MKDRMRSTFTLFVCLLTCSYFLLPISVGAEAMSGGQYQLNGAVTPLESTSQTGDYILHSLGDPIVSGSQSGGGFSLQPSVFAGGVVVADSGSPSSSGNSSSGNSSTCQIFASRNNITPGTQVALSWTNNRRFQFDFDLQDGRRISTSEGSGVVVVSPKTTTVYSATITGLNFRSVCYTTVYVNNGIAENQGINIFNGSNLNAADVNMAGAAGENQNLTPDQSALLQNDGATTTFTDLRTREEKDALNLKLSLFSHTVSESGCLRFSVKIADGLLAGGDSFSSVTYKISNEVGEIKQVINQVESGISEADENGYRTYTSSCHLALLDPGAYNIRAELDRNDGAGTFASNLEPFKVTDSFFIKVWNFFAVCGYWYILAILIGLFLLYKLFKKIIYTIRPPKPEENQPRFNMKPPDFS